MRLNTIIFALTALALTFFAALALRLHLISEAGSVWAFDRYAALVAAILFALILAAILWLWRAYMKASQSVAALYGETARQRTELAALRAETAAMLDDLEEGVLLCDTDHRILVGNAAATWLIGEQTAEDAEAGVRLPVEPLNEALNRLREALSQDRDTSARHTTTLTLTAPDGRSVTARMAAVTTPDGTLTGYVLALGAAQPSGDEA